MLRSPLRLLVAAVLLSASVALIGLGWEAARFGRDARATAAAVERDVRRRLAERTRQIESLAQRVARDEEARVAAAAATQEALAALFGRLIDLARRAGPSGTASATVYVPHASGYRVLAWSDGPAETLAADRLAGPSMLFIARGTVGLRLVYVQPIQAAGERAAVIAAETVLSPITNVGTSTGTFRFATTFGPVAVLPAAFGAGEGRDRPETFLIASAEGVPLLEVEYDAGMLAAGRAEFRRRVLAAAAVPLIAAFLLLTAFVRPGRESPMRQAASLRRPGDLVVAGILVAAGGALIALARAVSAPPGIEQTAIGMTSLGVAFLLPVSWWWRPSSRRLVAAAPVRFVLEQLMGGAVLAAALWGASRIIEDRLRATSLDRWRSPLFPFELDNVLSLAGVLLLQTAICWTAAAVLARLAARWRLSWRHAGAGLAAVVLWLAPGIALTMALGARRPVPVAGLAATALAAVLFALLASAIRRYYRHTTQAMRLLLVFAAIVLPAITLYPVAAFHAEARARHLIETEYMPAALTHRDELLAHLHRARAEIDRLPALAEGVAPRAPDTPITSALAFAVWNQTALSRNRVTSEIELYGPDRILVSRFALNVPEFQSQPAVDAWEGSTCTWNVYSRVQRFGAEDRSMWHAERAICDAEGRVRGGVVIHVVPDYRSLPFVSMGNPYRDALAGGTPTATRAELSDLQTVIYGWAFYPLFSSSRLAWPLDPALQDRVYASRDPFWTDLTMERQTYQVFVANDRAGIYAIGYADAGWFRHTARLAEAAALMGGVFVTLLVGATLYAPFTRRPDAPLRVLVTEIRTSFYRKLFLFFVLAAIVPVVLLTLAFGAYMGNRFQADVEYEAASLATVARRVFEELAAAERGPDQPAPTPSDDVMVWIQQVIDQDVNLYQGARLASTSQRDLFDSGLLPQRTPASAYRAIVLNRQPSYVAEDRIGAFEYLVAAAPVATSRDAVLSVPLALRQREIAQQLEQLNRGMLIAAVIVVLFAAGLGASVAGRVSDPVARLTRATRQIAAGRLDVRIVADTADELRRLVDDFNSMAETLAAQRSELARTNQLKAWAEMARQVAHEIKNPLTPIQLAAEHLQRVHEDQGRPLGAVFDQCVTTIVRQVRLLRQIASEFSNFAGQPAPRPAVIPVASLVNDVLEGYRVGGQVRLEVDLPERLPPVRVDRTLILRALTNIVENAVQAMPGGGTLGVRAAAHDAGVSIVIGDTGVGMDAVAVERAFEPYFSTKTAGSGLGLANAKRNIELSGGTISLVSTTGVGTTVTITLPAAPPHDARAGA